MTPFANLVNFPNIVILGLAWMALISATNAADEPATELPVRDGLGVWYDAAALPVPENADSAEELTVKAWPDSSGNRHDAAQPQEKARPRLVRVGESRVVRFDGIDDHLRATGIDRDLKAATIFLVAAPRANAGGFRAFLAANASGKNDFQSGFTIDQGPGSARAFRTLNVEGRGFTGARNLRKSLGSFGDLQFFSVEIDPQKQQVRLTMNGATAGSRPFKPSALQMDELTIGARFYNLGGSPQVRGHGAVDIAEILIYNRVLSEAESRDVREYLSAKHAGLREELAGSIAIEGTPLNIVKNPPPVQVFVPGFTVRQLPVSLPNTNNIAYRPDGSLMALGYNGNIYLLKDTDGDGLEDKTAFFWKNKARVRSCIGMALTPPGYKRGDGAFIATKSEVLLVVDTDGDDKADEVITVADGWSESFHNVDALGIAVDPNDQSIYFGLGTSNFAAPLLINKQGESQYKIEGERGTILHVAPDFKSRQVYCTGIRFPVALAFNAAGDLFCTDQEGATWVPNGNPFDELLHVQPDRHYGFPPRHPQHLPNVIDEPSTFDYAPQHQSTCGLTFNVPVHEGGPTFGPKTWAGDAFVCGYSRGKLYRTTLRESPAGYVAENQIFASLNMLIVDSAITPGGAMVVSVHSGGPDWGSGPSGKGKLYKIVYENPKAPQPVAAWPAGPDQVRVAFNKPLKLKELQGIASQVRITTGAYVRAGDEYESIRPGYDAVARQRTAPRYKLPVHSVQVTSDRRTLILTTDAQREAVWCAIQLPGLGRPPHSEPPEEVGGLLPQYPTIDLDYSLAGLSATWTSENAQWNGWLPHPDLAVCRAFTEESAPHAELWRLFESPGTLRLEMQLDLHDMLRPAVQPSSHIDYELPPETVTVRFESNSPFTLTAASREIVAKRDGDQFVVQLTQGSSTEKWLPIAIELKTEGNPTLHVSWTTAEDGRPRPLALRRLLLPWARPSGSKMDETFAKREIPELAGGDWGRGREIFFGEQDQCAACHTVRGQGESIGPDLSNLSHRDYASVRRDITDPSYAINPDYITHTIALADGHVLTGTLRNKDEQLLVSDNAGKVTVIDPQEIVESVPSAKSIMPEKLIERIGSEDFRDLMTFLLTAPPSMPLTGEHEPPAPRSAEEVAAVLAGAPDPAKPIREIKVVLVAGEKDHSPGAHDYPAWQAAWQRLLSAGEKIQVGTAWTWPSAEDFQTADVFVFYQKGTWNKERAKDIDAFLKRGGGLVYIHYAVDGGSNAPGFAQRIGLAWQGGVSKFRHGPLDLGFRTGPAHPIGRNFDRIKLFDESYWQLIGDPSRVNVLATGIEEGTPQPLFWTLEPKGGRVFVSIPGHFSWTFDDPLFRVLIFRGIAWTAGEPVDRFNELVPLGARIE